MPFITAHPNFKNLSDDAKLLACFVVGKLHRYGVQCLAWDSPRFKKGMDELCINKILVKE